MRILKQILFFTLIVVHISNTEVYAQIAVERSENKAIIDGVACYVHVVKKGETAYAISRAYGITVEELVKENPPVLYGVNEGQSLKIPVNMVRQVKKTQETPVVTQQQINHLIKKGETAYSISRTYGITVDELIKENPQAQYGINEGQFLTITVSAQSVPTQTQSVATRQKDEANYIYHVMKAGETIYSLSKQYDVLDKDIIRSNPEIDITQISVGTEIAIPRKQFMSESKKVEVADNITYIYHKVKQGESLSSIARQYNVAVRDLRRENRDVRFLQIGDYVRVPGEHASAEIIVDTINAALLADEPLVIDRPEAPTVFTKLSGKLNVAVLLPFYFNENRRLAVDSARAQLRAYRDAQKPEDWIYPGSLDFIEMYEGILLAVDTLRALGLDINLHTYDIQSDTIALSRLIRAGSLRNMDLIIGPIYSQNLKIATKYAHNLGIPIVSPVSLFNNSLLEGHSNLFMANSTLEVAQKAIAQKATEYYDHNIIIIHADSTGIDEDVKRFKNLIIKEMSTRMPFESIRFKEMLFLSRSMLGNDSINRLSHTLSSQMKNVVIIASEAAPVISETIMNIHGLSRRYDIKVLGYPLLRELENLEPRYFFDLDMFLYSTSWIDYSKPNVKQFNADFRKTFFTQPSEISFAWQGYDIAYYFISGLSIHGRDFLRNPSIHRPELLHTDFIFTNKSNRDGFENQKLFPIRYTKDFNVILEKNNP